MTAVIRSCFVSFGLAAMSQCSAAAEPGQSVQQPEWEKVCAPVQGGEECHTARRRVGKTGQTLAQVRLIERDKKALIQVAVPPVALIQPGVQLRIDSGAPIGVQYVVCTSSECLALGEANAEFIGRLKRGGELRVNTVTPQGKTVSFDISLTGFTKAYNGKGLSLAEAQAQQQKLTEELSRKADEARLRLIEAQQASIE